MEWTTLFWFVAMLGFFTIPAFALGYAIGRDVRDDKLSELSVPEYLEGR